MDVAQQSSSLMQLSDEDLIQIAGLVVCKYRRLVLPLVSKRWAQLLGVPSAAWEDVIIPVTDQEVTDSEFQNMVAWFEARSGSVTWLSVASEWPHPRILPRTVTLDILMTQTASLRELHLDLSAVALSSADTWVLLKFGALEMLHIIVGCAAGWDDTAALIKPLCLLPALRNVRIFGPPNSMFWQGSPTLVELATLHSTSLEFICWSVWGIPGTLVLGSLPALRICNLTLCSQLREGCAVQISVGSFCGVPGLTTLCLAGKPETDSSDRGGNPVRFVLQPGCLDSFSALESLRLVDCGLVGVPPALIGVQHTLRHLDLSDNPLVVDNAGLGTLLRLSSLDFVLMTECEGLGIAPRIDATKFEVLLPGESYDGTAKALMSLLKAFSKIACDHPIMIRLLMMCLDTWERAHRATVFLCELEAEEAAAGLAAQRTHERNRDKKARQRERKAAVAAAAAALAAAAAAALAAATAAARTHSMAPTRAQGPAAGAIAGPATAYVAEGSPADAATSAALHLPLAAPAGRPVLAASTCSSSNSGSRTEAGEGPAAATESLSPSRNQGAAEASAGSNLNANFADTGGAWESAALVDDDDDAELQALLSQLMHPHESSPATRTPHWVPPIAVPPIQPPVSEISALAAAQPAACSAAAITRRASRQAAAAETLSYLLCPLTKVQLVDPVIAADGQTYERAAMERWLAAHVGATSLLSPVTGETLPHVHLLPNLAVRSLLQDGA